MLRRSTSPLAVICALALTTATLLTGAWEAYGHGHEAARSSTEDCTVAHDAEPTGATDQATVRGSAPLHDHSCVACKLGRSKTAESGRTFGVSPLGSWSTAARPVNDGGQRSGERWQQTARGPPRA